METSDKSGRELALDGLRGIGALIVLFWHLAVHFFPAAAWGGQYNTASLPWESLIYYGPLGFLISGTFAVVLFFLLSGYVLTIGYLRNGDESAMYRKLISRIPRLFIPATVTTLIVYFSYQYLPYASGKTGADVLKATGSYSFLEPYLNTQFDYSLTGLLLNIFWLPWFDPDFKQLYNGVLWTMSIELSGSFLVMITAMALCRLVSRPLIPMVMLVLSGVPVWLYPGYGIYFTFFMLGCFIASLNLKPVLRGPRVTGACVLLVLAGLFAGGYTGAGMTSVLSFTQSASPSIPSLVLLKGAGAVLVFVATLLSADISRFLSLRFFGWLGRISFSLYLIHAMLIAYVGHNVFFALGEGVPLHYRTVLSSLATIAAVLAVSPLLARWVDEPAVRFSRAVGAHFVKKQSRQQQAASPIAAE